VPVELASADVSARVESIRPGDRVYLPRGNPEGYVVREVNEYEDGAVVVVYSTGRSSRFRFGTELHRTEDVLASLAPLRKGDRLRCRRGASSSRPAPRASSA